ncbi:MULTISPECIES: universal stress protein [Nocardia]|uniref:universal stress protein n=1 Tax=Nocardia salmonicida TaxID=53431 RepID=UPI00340723F8
MSRFRPEQDGDPGDRWHDAAIEQPHAHRDDRERLEGPLIVVGFDTSLASQHALAYAVGAAVRMRAGLLVAYISTLPNPTYLTSTVPMFGDIPFESEADQIAAAHHSATEILHDVAVSWSFTVRTGDAAAQLARLADNNNADVLVVGRTSSWLHRKIGSISARLLSRARCPVTVVP